MRASDVISSLQQRGIVLKGIDGRLKIGGAERLTEREKVALRAHKASILRALEPPPTIPTAPAGSQPVAPATAATEPLPSTEPAAANRLTMPHVAHVVDKFRRVFGVDQVKVIFAEENGARLGRQEAEPKAGTCYYCGHWRGTKSGNGYCVVGFAPPVAQQAIESCEQFRPDGMRSSRRPNFPHVT